MKKFTLNDFCNYFPTCFCCGKSTDFFVYSAYNGFNLKIDTLLTPISLILTPKVSYHFNINLEINKINNSFTTNNEQGFKEYINGRKFKLVSRCVVCKCEVVTHPLVFDTSKNILLPFTIKSENLVIKDDKGFTYYLDTDLDDPDKKSLIEIYSTKTNSDFLDVKTKLNSYPIYKFKTKERFIKKMITFLNFS